MQREFLKGLELESEVVDKIMAEYGKSVTSLKAEIEEKGKIEAEFDATKEQLEAVQKQLKEFEGSDSTIEELKEKLKAQADEYETFKSDIAKRETTRTKKDAILKALKASGAIEDGLDLLAGSVDLETIQLSKSGDIVDLEDVINPLKEKRKGLFATEQVGGEKPPQGEPEKETDTMTDQEYLAFRMKN